MKKIKIFLVSIMTLSAFMVPLASLTPVHAALFQNSRDEACQGVSGVSPSGGCDLTAKDKINTTLTNVLTILFFIVGVLAVIMIIIGGFRYITSGGDPNSVNGAKNTILYAIIGLVVAVLAQIIVRFVLVRI